MDLLPPQSNTWHNGSDACRNLGPPGASNPGNPANTLALAGPGKRQSAQVRGKTRYALYYANAEIINEITPGAVSFNAMRSILDREDQTRESTVWGRQVR